MADLVLEVNPDAVILLPDVLDKAIVGVAYLRNHRVVAAYDLDEACRLLAASMNASEENARPQFLAMVQSAQYLDDGPIIFKKFGPVEAREDVSHAQG